MVEAKALCKCDIRDRACIVNNHSLTYPHGAEEFFGGGGVLSEELLC